MQIKTVIKASAGTGKTYRLSLEYIYYLLKGIDFRTILVMTFTNKATFEIKERIFDFINQIVTNKGEAESLKENIEFNFGYVIEDTDVEILSKIYKEMLINKDSIRIHTIDGFVTTIFKSCISEPILSIYEYDLIEENSEQETAFYEELVLKLIKNKDFKYKFSDKNIEDIKKEIKKFTENKTEILQTEIRELPFSEEEIIRELKYLLLDKYSSEKGYKLTSGVNKLSEKIHDLDYDSVVKIFDEMFTNKKLNAIFDGRSRKQMSKLAENKEVFIDLINIIYKISMNNMIKATNDLVANATILFEEEFKLKKRKKILDYNDITYYTLSHIYDENLKLVEDDKITESFEELMGGKFDVVMIDEFQDTSIIQFKLLKLLINKAKYVTCVGDEKQSIYEWRGGYKQLFEELEFKLGQDTIVKNLDMCYRSEEKIIEFVNEKFTNLQGYNYINIESSKKEKNRGYVEIKKIVKESIPRTLPDEEKEKLSNKEFKEMVKDIKANGDYANSAVLLRGNKELEMVADLLEKENIPYSLSSRADFLALPVIADANRLVEYLVTKNEVKKYEFLRSKIFSYTLGDIQKIFNGEKELPSNFKKFLDNYEKVNSINSNIFDFSTQYLKYFGYGSKNPNKVDIVNLNEYFSIMKTFENLTDFYNHLKNNKSNRKPVIEKNSVQLMTIHASKGLEFKNVYTINDFKSKLGKNKYVKYDDEYNIEDFYYLDFKYFKRIYNILEDCTNVFYKDEILEYLDEIGIKEIYDNLTKNEKDGHYNLNYVAYTRARENLFIYHIEDEDILYGKTIYGKLDIEESIESYEETKDYTKYIKYFKPTEYREIDNERFSLNRVNKQKEGSAIHYFFEVYDGDAKTAKDTVKKKYGNLLSVDSFKRVEELIEHNLFKYKYLYEKKLKRYSEFKIYDKFDEYKMYKIDLLLIDDSSKKAYIYDFKTGEKVLENPKYKEQLENYKNILLEYLEDYEVYTEILPLEQ
ncbi:UvrD-helicase domain-containing protein [Pseudostreptobacillus hongkongensis]|uniref:UvrD-helicase domain-containing protein n=1 Tax=Pseudostreptobacillus hongkongensis TaxID=1162717 RepID=UPI0008360842|nr:UvrD-helicase domain-containing protein [Pseudostreptobacillus hongkongensis]